MDGNNNNNHRTRVHAAIGAIATCEVMTALYGCDWMFENVTVTLRGRLLGDRVGEEAKIPLQPCTSSVCVQSNKISLYLLPPQCGPPNCLSCFSTHVRALDFFYRMKTRSLPCLEEEERFRNVHVEPTC
ncbi:hypothetical protein NPIL_239471 [Nephila pilipes]|uniref:Uncharacterized protein n=1 Tax=Nephila pilipes TaxID=299642 RepID=A0A8X6QZ18_NEPPI|nr:hypothetical protein NPIL_239471 [Nephila pilipes]